MAIHFLSVWGKKTAVEECLGKVKALVNCVPHYVTKMLSSDDWLMPNCILLQIADPPSLKQCKLLEPHLVELKTILSHWLFLKIVSPFKILLCKYISMAHVCLPYLLSL